jgi:hypothetical protein
MMREGGMKAFAVLCLAVCVTAAFGQDRHAAGIEAAEEAEQLIASCHDKRTMSVPACLNYSLNRKWKYELDYTGKPFSAVGRFDEIKKSLLGNLFAFVSIGEYRVACKVTKKYAETLENLEGRRAVFVTGVMDSYHLIFNLHRYHHLRLTPYCLIEAAT